MSAGWVPTDPEFYSDRLADLRSLLATVQELDLWPPWDTVGRLVELVGQAATATMLPPDPDPAALTSARTGWRMLDQRADSATADLVRVPFHVSTAVWEGGSGDSFRSSVTELSGRVRSVRTACDSVEGTLEGLTGDMTGVRDAHRAGREKILDNLEISWSDLLPWEAYDLLTRRRGLVVDGVRETLGAYEDAAELVLAADRAIRRALDAVELPTRLPTAGGISTVDLLNGWDDDRGLLSGAALARYEHRFAELSPGQQRELREALASARSDAERAAILAGVGGGLAGAALTRYLQHLRTMDRRDIERMDPLTSPSDDVTQPDQTTCGSSSLVMARMLNDPAYAMWMRTGYDPETGETDPRSFEERFDDESFRVKTLTNDATSPEGEPQQPWPSFLGTPPWGAASEMNAHAGVPGSEYGNDVVDPSDPGRTFDAVQRASEDGHAVPLYIGDEWSPRHVVLVTGTDGDSLEVYDPASGSTTTISRDEFEGNDLGTSGWDQAWTAVVPR